MPTLDEQSVKLNATMNEVLPAESKQNLWASFFTKYVQHCITLQEIETENGLEYT